MNDIGFVYRWNDKSNNMYYIGSHKGSVDDGYIGSGVYFKKAYKKRPDLLSRDILYYGNDYYELEEFILEQLDCKNDINSYNLTNIGRGFSTETRLKMSKSSKGMKKSDSHKKSISETLKGSCNKGRKITDTNTGITYQSLLNYCNTFGLNNSTVWHNLNGDRKINKYNHLKLN